MESFDVLIQERDALRREIENLKAELDAARRRVVSMTVDIERLRVAVPEAEKSHRESQRKALIEAQAEAALHLRKLEAEFSEREARLLKAAEDARVRIEELKLELEQARASGQEAARGPRESHQLAIQNLHKIRIQAARRERALTKELAEHKTMLLKAVESRQRHAETMGNELKQARSSAQETARALREALERERSEAEDRLEMLTKASIERESVLIKAVENQKRRLEAAKEEFEKTVEDERRRLADEIAQARLAAQETVRALRESHQKEKSAVEERLAMMKKASAEREAVLLEKCDSLGRRVAAMAVELEWARRGAQSAEHAFRESQGKSITAAQAEAAERASRRAVEGGPEAGS